MIAVDAPELADVLPTLHPTLLPLVQVWPPVMELDVCEGSLCEHDRRLGWESAPTVAVVVTVRPSSSPVPGRGLVREETPVCAGCLPSIAAYWVRAGRDVIIAIPASVGEMPVVRVPRWVPEAAA